MATRQEKILACIDPASQLGLEIGALNRPIVTREMGDVRYVDHATTAELQQKYADDATVDVDQIVPVSYVWGEKPLVDLVGETRFDYVVASHVIEHVPDLIGWLKEIHAVLKPGGVLTLAIPDKRYCFDYFRQPTQPADVVEAYLRKQKSPGPRQIFDYYSHMAFWQGQIAWGQEPNFRTEDVTRVRGAAEAWQVTNQVFASGSYHDVHCWVFTPDSLANLLKALIQINLFDFKITAFHPPEGCEFFVALEAVDLTKDEAVRQQMQLESLLLISEEHELLAQQSLRQAQPSAAEFMALQEQLQRIQINLQRLKTDKQRLREKVKLLQAEVANRQQEVTAMQSSKFWQLRSKWLSAKKRLGLRLN